MSGWSQTHSVWSDSTGGSGAIAIGASTPFVTIDSGRITMDMPNRGGVARPEAEKRDVLMVADSYIV